MASPLAIFFDVDRTDPSRQTDDVNEVLSSRIRDWDVIKLIYLITFTQQRSKNMALTTDGDESVLALLQRRNMWLRCIVITNCCIQHSDCCS